MKRLDKKHKSFKVKSFIAEKRKYYFELHGAVLTRDGFIIYLDDYEVVYGKGMVTLKRDCDALKDNLCMLHGKKDKPLFCTEFDETTIKDDDIDVCRYKHLK